jgi:lipoprotein-releasing system permease protein
VAYLKGVDQNFSRVNDVKKTIYHGQWVAPDTYQAVVGYGIANNLSMGLFDFTNILEAFVPKPGKGSVTNMEQAFNKTELIPVGIYAISEDLDAKYVFADLGLVQELMQYQPNQISALEVKLSPGANEQAVIGQINKIFNGKLAVRTRAQQNDSLYKMLNTENIAVYLIFTLVIIIALFNLIGALIMMILDKKANLKTMLSLGASVNDLRKIFLLHGSLLTVAGGIIGLTLGIGLILAQQHFSLFMITESLPYPVVFSWANVFVVLVTIIALGILSSLIAASRVSKMLLE